MGAARLVDLGGVADVHVMHVARPDVLVGILVPGPPKPHRFGDVALLVHGSVAEGNEGRSSGRHRKTVEETSATHRKRVPRSAIPLVEACLNVRSQGRAEGDSDVEVALNALDL